MNKKPLKRCAIGWMIAIGMVSVSHAAMGNEKEQMRAQMEQALLEGKSPQEQESMRAAIAGELDLREALEQRAIKEGIDKTPRAKLLLRMARQEALARAATESIKERAKVSQEELKEDYAIAFPVKKQFEGVLAVFAKKERAERALESIKKGESSIEREAKESSDAMVAEREGKMGWVPLEALPASLAASIEAQAEGSLSEAPIETKFGFFIARVDHKKESAAKSFEEARDLLEKQRREMLLRVELKKIQESLHTNKGAKR